jgi:hypothetical protein
VRYDDPDLIPADDMAGWHPYANCCGLAYDAREGWRAEQAFEEMSEPEFIRLFCYGIDPDAPTKHRECPVRRQCGDWARGQAVFYPGVYGGMTTAERLLERRRVVSRSRQSAEGREEATVGI